jgi:hypothetical protein
MALHPWVELDLFNELPPLLSWLALSLQFLHPTRATSSSTSMHHLNTTLVCLFFYLQFLPV